MPAAAVIPAPIAYIKVVAVKKLVVGCMAAGGWCAARRYCRPGPRCWGRALAGAEPGITLKKLECLKRAIA